MDDFKNNANNENIELNETLDKPNGSSAGAQSPARSFYCGEFSKNPNHNNDEGSVSTEGEKPSQRKQGESEIMTECSDSHASKTSKFIPSEGEDRSLFPTFRFMPIQKKLGICSIDHPRKSLSLENLLEIGDSIQEAILSPEGQRVRPRFFGTRYTNGVLVIICGDHTTLEWVKSLPGRLKTPSNLHFKILEESNVSRTVQVQGRFKKSLTDTDEMILKYLEVQNVGMDFSKWRIIDRKLEKKTFLLLTFLIDWNSAEKLRARGPVLNYKLGCVTLTVDKKSKMQFHEENIRESESEVDCWVEDPISTQSLNSSGPGQGISSSDPKQEFLSSDSGQRFSSSDPRPKFSPSESKPKFSPSESKPKFSPSESKPKFSSSESKPKFSSSDPRLKFSSFNLRSKSSSSDPRLKFSSSDPRLKSSSSDPRLKFSSAYPKQEFSSSNPRQGFSPFGPGQMLSSFGLGQGLSPFGLGQGLSSDSPWLSLAGFSGGLPFVANYGLQNPYAEQGIRMSEELRAKQNISLKSKKANKKSAKKRRKEQLKREKRQRIEKREKRLLSLN